MPRHTFFVPFFVSFATEKRLPESLCLKTPSGKEFALVRNICTVNARWTAACCLILAGSMDANLQANTVASPFTVVVLPDTQYYSESYPTQFVAQTQWIADNRSAENIVLVSHVGDVVENGGSSSREWEIADAAMSILDEQANSLPYGVAAGNHDLDNVNVRSSADKFVRHFGAARFQDRDWYGGSSANQLNHFQKFSMGERSFMHLTMEWRPDAASISWAEQIMYEHSNIPTMITTHEYLDTDGARISPAGTDIFDELVYDHSQVFMVFSGHVPGEGYNIARNAAGTEVFEMVADYQFRSNGGDGWLRLIQFDESNDRIHVKTYSPTRQEYETDSDSQFSWDIDFDTRFGSAPEPAGNSRATLICLLAVWYLRRSERYRRAAIQSC